MVATLAEGTVIRMHGQYAKSVKMGVSSSAAGVADVTSPAPPSPYTDWIEFDTSKVHNLSQRICHSTGPSAPQSDGMCAQYHVRRDGGTISQACVLASVDGAAAGSTNKNFNLHWNTSGNLEVYIDGRLITTVSISTNTTAFVSIYMRNLVSGAGAGASGYAHQVVVFKDGTQICNVSFVASGTINWAAAPIFGENAAAGSNTLKWYVLPIWASYCDWSNPVPKMTIKEWTLTLAATPVFDEGVKSTGTDAAALVDERAPSGSGTTDVDYFDANPGGFQGVVLANSLLGGGDTLYAYKTMVWDRGSVASKTLTGHGFTTTPNENALLNGAITSGATSVTYDTAGSDTRPLSALVAGSIVYIRVDLEWMQVTADSGTVLTVIRGINGSTAASHADNTPIKYFRHDPMGSYSGGTSYAQHLESSQEYAHVNGPDELALSGKTNTYLDTLEVGWGSMPSSDASSNLRTDAIVVEAAINVSGDTAPTLPNPPSFAPRRRALYTGR